MSLHQDFPSIEPKVVDAVLKAYANDNEQAKKALAALVENGFLTAAGVVEAGVPSLKADAGLKPGHASSIVGLLRPPPAEAKQDTGKGPKGPSQDEEEDDEVDPSKFTWRKLLSKVADLTTRTSEIVTVAVDNSMLSRFGVALTESNDAIDRAATKKYILEGEPIAFGSYYGDHLVVSIEEAVGRETEYEPTDGTTKLRNGKNEQSLVSWKDVLRPTRAFVLWVSTKTNIDLGRAAEVAKAVRGKSLDQLVQGDAEDPLTQAAKRYQTACSRDTALAQSLDAVLYRKEKREQKGTRGGGNGGQGGGDPVKTLTPARPARRIRPPNLKGVKLVIVHHDSDRPFVDEFIGHVDPLLSAGAEMWDRSQMVFNKGAFGGPTVRNLGEGSMALMFMSPAFLKGLTSRGRGALYNQEDAELEEVYKSPELAAATRIPVLCRPCDWEAVPMFFAENGQFTFPSAEEGSLSEMPVGVRNAAWPRLIRSLHAHLAIDLLMKAGPVSPAVLAELMEFGESNG